MKLVPIGRVTRPHGVRGECKVLEGYGSSGAWAQASEVHIGKDAASARPFKVRAVRHAGKFAVLDLEAVTTVEAAQELREQLLFVDRALLPPAEDGAYYEADLLGLEVVDGEGRVLGCLTGIFDNGAHDIYVVAKEQGELLVPVIDGVVQAVDLEGGRMVVALPSGLDE